MGVFIKKLILFLIPIGLIFVFPITVFLFSKEYYSPEKAEKTQITHPEAIIGFAYGTSEGYKELLMSDINPSVMSLGTSRVMQFRKEFFSDPKTFGNAGGSVGQIEDMEKFIRKLPPDNKLKLLIIGLDQQLFKHATAPREAPENTYERLKYLFVGGWKKVYKDYFSHKFSMKQILEESKHTDNIGLNALINKDGFRSDGSYQYAEFSTNPNQEKNTKSSTEGRIMSIKKDRSSFLYGKEIYQSDLDSLENLLKLCVERGIYVIGILPPYPNVIYKEIISADDEYKKVLIELPNKVSKILLKNNFKLYDFSDISVINGDDYEFMDPIHGTDKIYLRMIIYMAEKNKEFSKYVDINRLRNILKHAQKNFLDADALI